jgi:hypothetical protein
MSDGSTALFAYGTEVAAANPATIPRPPVQPTVSNPPPPGPHADTAAETRVVARLTECLGKAITYLDDGTSSVEGAAEAVLASCRPELGAICETVAREAGLSGFCGPQEIAREFTNARPDVAARVLRHRAAGRLRSREPPSRLPRETPTPTFKES